MMNTEQKLVLVICLFVVLSVSIFYSFHTPVKQREYSDDDPQAFLLAQFGSQATCIPIVETVSEAKAQQKYLSPIFPELMLDRRLICNG